MTIEQESEESVSPLFNKMDALLARHRGNARGKEEDILPVLTEVAEDQGPIPVLTEVALTPASSLMFDPTEFLAPQPLPLEPIPVVAEEIEPPKEEPEFLDLPLLDLESLLRERAPFGPNAAPLVEPLGEEQDETYSQHTQEESSEVRADSTPVVAEAAPPAESGPANPDETHQAAQVATFVDQFHQDQPLHTSAAAHTLHWEEADEVDEFAHAYTQAAEPSPATEPVASSVAHDDAPDWSPVAPWWTDDAPADDAETLAASVSVGYVTPESVTELAETEDHAVSVDWQAETDTPLELDLDAFREEDSAEPDWVSTAAADGIQHIDAPSAPLMAVEAATVPAPPLPALMNEAAISEMTASVAAHLAVDISTEVEQLTRRHFAQMMQTLYGEALTRMIDQVGMELEARLAPRIDALVREELQARGLTGTATNPATDQN